MKKVLLVCAFLVGLSAVSFAQGGRPQQTPDQQLERLKTTVTGITDDQAAKIKVIYTASAKSNDSLRAAPGYDRQTSQPAAMAIRTATNAKINAVLTADQQKLFATMAQGRGGRGGQGGGNGGGQGGAPATPPAK